MRETRHGPRYFAHIYVLFVLMLFQMLAGAAWANDVLYSVYGGVSKTEASNVSYTDHTLNPPQKSTQSVSIRNSHVIGGRIERWDTSKSWFGTALDLSYFRTNAAEGSDILSIDHYVGSISAIVRLPVENNGMFNRKIQPYAGIGAGEAISKVRKLPLSNVMDGMIVNSVALNLNAGIHWLFDDESSMFMEYRMLYFLINHTESLAIYTKSSDTEVPIVSHQLLLGYRF